MATDRTCLNEGNRNYCSCVTYLLLYHDDVFPTLAWLLSIKGLLKWKHFRGHFLTWLVNQVWHFYPVLLYSAWVRWVDLQPHRKCERIGEMNTCIKWVWASVFISLLMDCTSYLEETHMWHFSDVSRKDFSMFHLRFFKKSFFGSVIAIETFSFDIQGW